GVVAEVRGNGRGRRLSRRRGPALDRYAGDLDGDEDEAPDGVRPCRRAWLRCALALRDLRSLCRMRGRCHDGLLDRCTPEYHPDACPATSVATTKLWVNGHRAGAESITPGACFSGHGTRARCRGRRQRRTPLRANASSTRMASRQG